MAKWINRSIVQPTSGGPTDTYTFTTPAAGSLLVAVVYGAVTSTTPSGWTLVQSAVNNGGIYVFSKTAAGTETSLTTTHNGTGDTAYPTVCVVYEFPSGSTVAKSAAASNAGTNNVTGAAISALTGTNLLMMAVGEVTSSTENGTGGFSGWSNSGVTDTDVHIQQGGSIVNGYVFGVGYVEGSTLTSWTPTTTVGSWGASAEEATLAINVSAAAGSNLVADVSLALAASLSTTALVPLHADATEAITVGGSASGNVGHTAAASLAATATITAGTGPVGVPGNWGLSFSDEFTGTSLDTTKWQPNWYAEGGSMNNVGTYAANIAVGGGQATLTLASSTSGALMHTDFPGGYKLPVGSYVEARVKFAGDGTNLYNWPAWWATSTSADGWPNAGENDIAEVSSSGAGVLAAHYHWPPSNSLDAYTQTAYMGDAFHVYGLYRHATTCDLYWDGVKVATYATADNGDPEILVFNVGVKSDSNGTQTGSTGAMVIDWVRAWQPVAAPVSAGVASTATTSTSATVAKFAAAALTVAAAITSTVTVTHGATGDASVAATSSIAAGVGLTQHVGASLAATSSITADATVTHSNQTAVSLAATGSIAASASVNHAASASLGVNAATATGATRSTSADAATNIVAATTTSGLRATSTGATCPITASIATSATVTSPGQIAAVIPFTANLNASARNSTTGTSNLTAAVVTVTTTATRSATGAASLPVVALLTGTATRGVAGSASLEGTAAIAASVNVSGSIGSNVQVEAALACSATVAKAPADVAIVTNAAIVADVSKVTHGDATPGAGYLTVNQTNPSLTVSNTMPDLEVVDVATFVEGDTSPDLTVSAHTDLTGASVVLHIERPDGTVVTGNGAITDVLNGVVTYAWQTGDLDQSGVFSVEAQVTYSNGQVQTIGPATFSVRPQIA